MGGPLHVSYAGQSQLEKALELVAVDAAYGKPVTMLTLNIGANDQLHAIAACEAEVDTEYETEGKSKYPERRPKKQATTASSRTFRV